MKTRNDGISWTHDTWNPWMGCDKVSEECQHCYIDRIKAVPPYGTVVQTQTTWGKPLPWEKKLSSVYNPDGTLKPYGHCPACGNMTNTHIHRVKCGGEPEQYMRMFTCSLSDFFHAEADKWRDHAWDIIKRTPHVVYLILTKRPERILKHLPADWGTGYPNVWLGTSIGSNKRVHRADTLRKVPAAVRFLSCEPLLENISDKLDITGIQWVIAGGESGMGGEEYLYNPKKRWQDEPADGRRTMKLEWAYKLYMKASDAGVPFFFKQITSARSGVGADRLIGKEIHEFPAPPNGGVWWEPPSELVVLR